MDIHIATVVPTKSNSGLCFVYLNFNLYTSLELAQIDRSLVYLRIGLIHKWSIDYKSPITL